MAQRQTTKLSVSARSTGSSRDVRRLRRAGEVPGVVYGGGKEPMCFKVGARDLRHALAGAGAVLELTLDGGESMPVVLKDMQVHPVRGELMHVDLLRVDLNVAIHAVVTLELIGAEDAPGAKEGGVLEHVTREVNVEALPTDIPESLQCDVSQMQINDTLTLAAVTPPPGVTLLDDLDHVVATLTPPRLELELEEEIEEETEVVGEAAEGEREAEAQAEGATGEEAESAEAGGE